MTTFTCAQCACAGTPQTFTTRFELAVHGLTHPINIQEVAR